MSFLGLGLPSAAPPQPKERHGHKKAQNTQKKAIDESGLEFRLKTLLANPARLAAMRARAVALGRAFAGRDVLSIVLGGM